MTTTVMAHIRLVRIKVLTVVAALIGWLPAAHADWLEFRGSDANGHANTSSLPSRWSETENVSWKTAIAGRGWSSPVVAGDSIWLTTAVETTYTEAEKEEYRKEKLKGNPLAKEMEILKSISLVAIEVDLASGKVLKEIPLTAVDDPPSVHSLNSFASPTPIWSQGKLFCHFGSFGTFCVDTKLGKIDWSQKLVINHSVGPGSSPVLFGELLIIPCDGTDEQYVIALNRKTGETVWKTPRPDLTEAIGEMRKSFCTPLLIQVDGQDQVVIPGARWIISYDPQTGAELWKLFHGDGFSVAPRPVFASGAVYFSTGYMVPQLIAVSVDGSGDVTTTHQKWAIKRQVPTMPSPIVVGSSLFFVSDQGVATCADLESGKQLGQRRLGGNFSASPIVAGDKLYFSNRDGITYVVAATPELNEIATNQLDGQLMASPAVAGKSLILRTDKHLYRIAEKGSK